MARNFGDVLTKILDACPNTVLHDKLLSASPYWAPEILWHNLTRYVNTYMKPDSNDPVSVKVYAALCDLSEEEMQSRFKEDGR